MLTYRVAESIAQNLQITETLRQAIEASAANQAMNEVLTKNAQAIGRQMSESIAQNLQITETLRQIGKTFASTLTSTTSIRQLSYALSSGLDATAVATFAQYVSEDRLNREYQIMLEAFAYLPGASEATCHEVATAVEASTDEVATRNQHHLVARRFVVIVTLFVVVNLLIHFNTVEHILTDEAKLAAVIAPFLVIYQFIIRDGDKEDPPQR